MKRTPYYVPGLDPESEHYGITDSQCVGADIEPRRIDRTERANAWCSKIDGGTMHLPCIDIDVELNDRQEELLDAIFPDWEWVDSSTPGHGHLYHEWPITWEVYSVLLDLLVREGIVQEGYVNAMQARRATFVRMPHIKKRKEQS